jgi:hypothetical protein
MMISIMIDYPECPFLAVVRSERSRPTVPITAAARSGQCEPTPALEVDIFRGVFTLRVQGAFGLFIVFMGFVMGLLGMLKSCAEEAWVQLMQMDADQPSGCGSSSIPWTVAVSGPYVLWTRLFDRGITSAQERKSTVQRDGTMLLRVYNNPFREKCEFLWWYVVPLWCPPPPGTRYFQPFPHLVVRIDKHHTLRNAFHHGEFKEKRLLII